LGIRLRLFLLVKPYWLQIIVGWVVILLGAIFTMIVPALLAFAIDSGLKPEFDEDGTLRMDGKVSLLVITAALILAAGVFRSIFSFFQTFIAEWLSLRVAFDLRNLMFDRLQRLSHSFHDKQQTGQLMSRVTQDVEATRIFIALGAFMIIGLLARMGVAAVLMFASDWRLSLVAWAVLPIVAIRSIQVQLSMRKVWMEVQERLGRVTTILHESLAGVRVVRAFSREQWQEQKFNDQAEDLFRWSYQQNRIQAVNTPFYAALGMFAQAAVLWSGAMMVANGSLSPGQLTAFMAYVMLLLMPVRMLGLVVSQFARAGAAGERIFEILDAESEVKEIADAITLEGVEGHVVFEDVSFSYDTLGPVLSSVNLNAPPGTTVALVGPTGSGKTTVVNLLLRFYDVTSGRITVDGVDIRDLTLNSLRSNVGIIQQDIFLFSTTIRDNLAYGVSEATDEQIISAAKVARIHDFVMSLPDGYDTWVGERGITLSGGQKQRIAIARTLLRDPRILILDDSTSSLDTQTEALIQQALAAVMKERTTFVIAQRLSTVKNAHQILVLRDGRIVERGTHEALINADGLYREIYELELRGQERAARTPAGAGASEQKETTAV
jgi:ABC-type multidrug transport system fused ATPase/permease subunit